MESTPLEEMKKTVSEEDASAPTLDHIPGYPYLKRTPDGYNEITIDPGSSLFHPAQILTALNGFLFPPYAMAGLSDLIMYIQNEERSTHLSDEGQIWGATFNVVLPWEQLQPKFKMLFPEWVKFADEMKDCVESGMDHAEVVDKIEEKCGSTVGIDPLMFTKQNPLKILTDMGKDVIGIIV